MNRPALRLAHATPPPTVQVLTAATQPSAAGPALRLLPAGLPVPLDGVPTAQLPLSGLGACYLVAVARRAAAAGWPAPELAALVAELAPRCRHLRISRRSHRGLQPFAEAAAARGAVCVALVCGRPPRRLAAQVDRLAAAGSLVHRRQRTHGWTVELLAVPRLTGSQLQQLRERFASAPRCDWCGLPVPGSHCPRCTAEPSG